MRRIEFSWTLVNTEHIGKHGVNRAEAEYVVRQARSPYPRDIEDDKVLVWGRTPAGRYLQVIFALPRDEDIDPSSIELVTLEQSTTIAYVLHARELDPLEKKQHRRRSLR